MAIVFIETLRLLLREWKESDHEPYIALNADKDVMEFFPSVLSAEESVAQAGRITAHLEKYGFTFFAVERKDNSQFIGFTGLAHARFQSDFTPCVEIGWRLSKTNWGHGFATEAATACLAYGFQKLGLDAIYSFTSIHNKRSEEVMKRIGMVHAGEFDHPLVDEGSSIRRHVLYKLEKH